jgi:hypothetical protein
MPWTHEWVPPATPTKEKYPVVGATSASAKSTGRPEGFCTRMNTPVPGPGGGEIDPEMFIAWPWLYLETSVIRVMVY